MLTGKVDPVTEVPTPYRKEGTLHTKTRMAKYHQTKPIRIFMYDDTRDKDGPMLATGS